MGDTSTIQTPVGLSVMKEVGLYLSLFIGNSKGGRNESFMYGTDLNTKFFDYDFTSAYTTAMCLLGNPNYALIRMITGNELLKLISEENFIYEIIEKYVILKAKFEFPE